MATIIVLFNLKSDADRDRYERWARETDLPTVRRLPSCRRFDAFRVRGLLRGGGAPYEYVEVIDITSLEAFRADLADEAIQSVATEFHSFAADPVFMVADPLDP